MPTDPGMTVAAGKDVVDALMGQAADQAAMGTELGTRIQEQFGTWQETADTVALHGLLPLAMTLLILHQFYECSVQDKPFAVRYILIRTGVVAGLLMSYGFVVSLITGVAGGSGEWADWDAIVGPVARGAGKRFDMYSDGIEIAEIPGLLLWLVLLSMVLFCTLLAYVAALLLSIAQGVLLAIILAVGKTCIVVSLVPGLALGKSWAKYLAMVAAWSMVAGIVSNVVLGHVYARTADDAVYGGNVGFMLQTAGIYLVFAIFTLAVPRITSALFSGASSASPGVLGALAMGVMGARVVGKGVTRRADAGVGKLRERLGVPRRGDGGGGRPHKAPHRGSGPDEPPGVGVGGSGERHGDAFSRYEGKAAADYKKPSAGARDGGGGQGRRGSARRAASIPDGSPGAQRWTSASVSAAQREAHRRRTHRSGGPPPGVPDQNAAMARRVGKQQATLQSAYPDLRWNPDRLRPRERAIVSELDSSTGRFAGWEGGSQGRGDFAEAGELAERRWLAQHSGQAATAAPYVAPRSSAPRTGANAGGTREPGAAQARPRRGGERESSVSGGAGPATGNDAGARALDRRGPTQQSDRGQTRGRASAADGQPSQSQVVARRQPAGQADAGQTRGPRRPPVDDGEAVVTSAPRTHKVPKGGR